MQRFFIEWAKIFFVTGAGLVIGYSIARWLRRRRKYKW